MFSCCRATPRTGKKEKKSIEDAEKIEEPTKDDKQEPQLNGKQEVPPVEAEPSKEPDNPPDTGIDTLPQLLHTHSFVYSVPPPLLLRLSSSTAVFSPGRNATRIPAGSSCPAGLRAKFLLFFHH